MDKTLVFIVIGVILLGVAFWAWQTGVFSGQSIEPVPIPEGIVLFYGDGCPHCENVDEFVAENNIEEKISFTKLEVWYNKNSQNILAQVVEKCGIAANQVGVPFLWDGETCVVGDTSIIEYFKNAAGIE